jgi:hypothetical protein
LTKGVVANGSSKSWWRRPRSGGRAVVLGVSEWMGRAARRGGTKGTVDARECSASGAAGASGGGAGARDVALRISAVAVRFCFSDAARCDSRFESTVEGTLSRRAFFRAKRPSPFAGGSSRSKGTSRRRARLIGQRGTQSQPAGFSARAGHCGSLAWPRAVHAASRPSRARLFAWELQEARVAGARRGRRILVRSLLFRICRVCRWVPSRQRSPTNRGQRWRTWVARSRATFLVASRRLAAPRSDFDPRSASRASSLGHPLAN